MDLILATNNAHKAQEIEEILGGEFSAGGGRVLTLKQAGLVTDPDEIAGTFLGNAKIKARAAFDAAADSGRFASYAVLADDSGLEVDALEGAPGVYSSRYAGKDGNDAANNELLLKNLEGVADLDRTARFVCTLVYFDTNGKVVNARGTVEGKIAHELNGSGGFGYDPLFLPDEFADGRTFGQATAEEKNAISHRSRALQDLKAQL